MGVVVIAFALGGDGVGVPIVGAEGTDGQAIVHEVTFGPVAPGITNGGRLTDLVALDIDAIARDPYLRGWVEYAVLACYLEVWRGGAVLEVDPLLGAVEADDAGVEIGRAHV